MMVVWGLLLAPTLLFWKESILWVASMSLYANFVGHFASWDAARAESNSPSLEDIERLEAKLDQINARLLPRSSGDGPSW
jgi:hypothetical protein